MSPGLSDEALTPLRQRSPTDAGTDGKSGASLAESFVADSPKTGTRSRSFHGGACPAPPRQLGISTGSCLRGCLPVLSPDRSGEEPIAVQVYSRDGPFVGVPLA